MPFFGVLVSSGGVGSSLSVVPTKHVIEVIIVWAGVIVLCLSAV